ncbi:MAG: hypothetical protein QOE61_5805 [Micromonosporaceae bacterium]|jgi:hypothetical protein|nr:hypothetical protein [Micromonosporaceae bacterium]
MTPDAGGTRIARDKGLVSLDDRPFTARVLARTSAELKVSRLPIAPIGTPAEQMADVLDSSPEAPDGQAVTEPADPLDA